MTVGQADIEVSRPDHPYGVELHVYSHSELALGPGSNSSVFSRFGGAIRLSEHLNRTIVLAEPLFELLLAHRIQQSWPQSQPKNHVP